MKLSKGVSLLMGLVLASWLWFLPASFVSAVDLDIYFVEYQGKVWHATIMDRNLWATSSDVNSPSSYGNYYQWWNNYGFNRDWNFASTWNWVSSGVWSQYVPSRYNSGVFVKGYYNWMSWATVTDNIWWWWWDSQKNNGHCDNCNRNGNIISRRGPCPEWYHVPSHADWDDIWNYMYLMPEQRDESNKYSFVDSWNNWKSILLIPTAGYLNEVGTFTWTSATAYLWTSSPKNLNKTETWILCADQTNCAQYFWFWITKVPGAGWSHPRAYAQPIRCFKDETNPSIIDQSSMNGWKGAIVVVQWDKITRLDTPTKDNATFGGWYRDANFKYQVKVWDTAPSKLYAKWTCNPWYDEINGECNVHTENTTVKDLDLYFLWDDGRVKYNTIMDRNLWATEVYNQNYSSQNKASYGNYYQWWNNYGFSKEGVLYSSSEQVDASGYGPGNYYFSGLFINDKYSRQSSDNKNLWWWESSSITDKQWPCPAWYHVPSSEERGNIYKNWQDSQINGNNVKQWASDLLLPFPGFRTSKKLSDNHFGYYLSSDWSSVYANQWLFNVYILLMRPSGSVTDPHFPELTINAHSVRCFKNTTSQKMTIQANGWTKAVVSVDGNKITTLWTPIKDNATFGGWYSNANFKNRVQVWSNAPSNLYAKWNCNSWYREENGKCVSWNTRTGTCVWLPANAYWVNSGFVQTWSGTENAWTPSSGTLAYTWNSSVWCSYLCRSDYTLSGGSCQKNSNSCLWRYPVGAIPSAVSPTNNTTTWSCATDTTKACTYTCPAWQKCNSSKNWCVKIGCVGNPSIWDEVSIVSPWDTKTKWKCVNDRGILTKQACTYTCPSKYVCDEKEGVCVEDIKEIINNGCIWDLPANAELWKPSAVCDGQLVECQYVYSEDYTEAPCRYKCEDNYEYKNKNCVKKDDKIDPVIIPDNPKDPENPNSNTNFKELFMDPSNRQQHIQVKLIQDDSNNVNNYAILSKTWASLTHITLNSDSNIVMKSASSNNYIQDSSKSNILWWNENLIQGASFSTILWWDSNTNVGWYSTILWWKSNKVLAGGSNTILWWSNNTVYEWDGSAIAWWYGNNIGWNYSVTVWSKNSISWDYSVALWTGSKVNADNSFLWTDGSLYSALTGDNLFVVMSHKWMVVNTTAAHSFAKLTIWWPLVVYDSEKDPEECNSDLKWVMKVVEWDSGRKCFCSCDGLVWSSMYGAWRCEWKCNPSIMPKCGKEVIKFKDGDKFNYKWECEVWYPVDWVGAYFVDKNNWVHWSCQTDDGQVDRCQAWGIVNEVENEEPCPEWEVYDERDGKCKKACLMSAEFGSVTVMDKDGYAITVADRNLWATSNNVNDLTSFGCFYQWWNNCGFQPVWDITISTEKVNVSGVGPSSYNKCEYIVSPSCDSRECTDSDWAQNPNHNLWWWWNDSSNNAFGVLDTDKVKRKWPCPSWWHVPSQWEWSDLLTIWYNKEYSQNLQYVKDTHKIQAFKDNENLVSKFRNKFYLAPAWSRSNKDATPDGMYQIWWSYWASSSPWKIGSLSSQSLIGDSRIGRFPNDAYSFDYSETYIWNGVRWIKNSWQSVRCFKDVPDCPLWSTWNPVTLKCECNNGGNIANDCGIPQCTWNIPSNATGNNTRVPTLSTWWYYSTNLSLACTYRCDTGYVYSWGNCELWWYSCQWTKPENATLLTWTDKGLTGYATNTLYENKAKVLNNKCAYLCNNGYKYTRIGTHATCMELQQPICKEVLRSNVKLVKNSDKGLEEDTNATLYPKESLVPAGAKCAYVCAEWYDYICEDNTCSCAVCKEGTYNPDTYKCVIEQADCGGFPGVNILHQLEDGTYECWAVWNCQYNGWFLKSVPSDWKQYEYRDAQPIWIGDTDWSCVSWTPQDNMCQYQCNDWLSCVDGSCVSWPAPSCDVSTLPHNSRKTRQHPTRYNQAYEYDYGANQYNWCYFKCNYAFRREDGECKPNSCDNTTLPEWAKNNVWVSIYNTYPEQLNQSYKYDESATSSSDWCFYKCKKGYGEDGYVPVKDSNGNVIWCEQQSCKKSSLPSRISTTNAYIYDSYPIKPDQEYEYDESATSRSDWCFYKCKEGFEPVKSNGKVIWCKEKNSCVNLPEGAVSVSENATWVNQSYVYSGGATSSSTWCYYRCDTANGYKWIWNKCVGNSCKESSLPNIQHIVTFGTPTKQNEEYQYDRTWTKTQWCYYKCDSNYTPEEDWNGNLTACNENSCNRDTLPNNISISSLYLINAKPTSRNQTYEYDRNWTKTTSSEWCYYRCYSSYKAYTDWNGNLTACKKKTCDSTSLPSNIEKNRLYTFGTATDPDQSYEYDRTWTKTQWCYYKCYSKYTPEEDWNGNLLACEIPNSCGDLPSNAKSVSAHPTEPDQPYQYDDTWTRDDTSEWCYYVCKSNKYIYRGGKCVEADTLCKDAGCNDGRNDGQTGCKWEDEYNWCRWSRPTQVVTECPKPFNGKPGLITNANGIKDCVRCLNGTSWNLNTHKCE